MRKRRRIRHPDANHPLSDTVAIWILRILINLTGWKSYSGRFSSYTCDGELLRSIKLGYLEDTDIDKDTFLKEIHEQQTKFSNKKIKTCPFFKKNIKQLKKLVRLSGTEIKILTFAIAIHSQRGLDNAADLLGELSAGGVITALSVILDLPQDKIQNALSSKGKLARSGLLRFSKGNMEKLCGRLTLMEGLYNVLSSPESGNLLRHYFIESKPANLKPADYEYIYADYQFVKNYINNASRHHCKGINILVHGRPGTGKSELARTLSEDLGLQLYEISSVDEDDEPIDGNQRFTAYQLSQQVLSQQQKALILFDEIEDVFPCTDSFFNTPVTVEKRKAWVNQQLEENPVPTLWISNEIEQMDKAFIRRFDYILNLQEPPKKVREAILEKYLIDIPVSRKWIEEVAENKNLVPAIISRAARVVSIANSKKDIEQQLERVIGNTLHAMGHCNRLTKSKEPAEQISYRLDALNPDSDIKKLIKGLIKHPDGRLCLYGPPGTGKTAFGRYLAKELGQNLLIKRASDILGAYVGVTEKNIAEMFKQARMDNSILMLDEADSFLQNRNKARAGWEVTQVNELLTQMEEFEGIFICSTNLVDTLDSASLRRFDLKIKFDFLRSEQAWTLFTQTLLDHACPINNESYWKNELNKLTHLTPGDFATAVRKNKITGESLSPEVLVKSLMAEVSFKQQTQSRGIGFTAHF